MNSGMNLAGNAATTTQLRQFTGTTDHLLALLSRSRPRPENVEPAILSRLIRLSQLRVEGGPAVAVLTVARDGRGATQLRTQRRLVAEIANQPGLDDGWRELLPRVLSFDERPDATVCVESYRPGIGLADVLANDPDRFEELSTLALDAIAPLHRATARSIVVDNLTSVRQWVADPAADLAHVCDRLNPALTPKLERLEAILARAIVGRRMTVCWTHGAYTPDSVRLTGTRGAVNRIVGWDEARGDRPALIDTYLMILTASCQLEAADLGAVVSRRLTAGGLSASERNVLKAAGNRRGTGVVDPDGIDERTAILLAWLHHSAAVCRTDADRLPHDGWLASDVTPVLDAVEVRRGLDALRAADAS
jgi:hypothetical protein